MRVAICLAGQPRCWQRAVDWYRVCFSHYTDAIDVFYHFWNYKTVPKSADFDNNSLEIVDANEFAEMNKIYKPKKYIIDESQFNVPNYLQELTSQVKDNLPLPFSQIESQSVAHQISFQYYSWMKVAQLKRQYEIENNFEYDVCVHGRSDLIWKISSKADQVKEKLMGLTISNEDIPSKLARLPKPEPRNVYTVHNTLDFPYPGVGDVFWYADSLTFDIASNFFRGLPYIQDSMFYTKITPEKAFLYYLKMMNLVPYSLDPDIIPLTVRDKKYIDTYGLKPYEAA